MPNKGRLQNRCARAVHAILVSALVLSSLAVLGATTAAPAAADIGAELAEPSLGHVTSDALPTVQINGVVWDQTIIGSTVYAVGEFSSARPAGDPAGTNETPRSNILAYDLTTGELIHTFAPSLNAEGTTVTASPDGSRLFIGGSFTQVNGVSQYRIAALNPNSGELIAGFNATVDYHVNDLVATDSQLFAAGSFNYAGAGLTAARSRLAAFSASNGALISGWAPVADNSVMALVIAPDGTKIFAGGRFTTMNGSAAKGLAAIDIQTGAVTPWAANTVVKNGGASAAILSLSTDGTSIFGGGYTYGRADGNLEGSFSANPTTGEMNWVADCHGDMYDTVPLNGYLYTASHAHYCGNVNGFPQTDPWSINQRHLNSFETTASSTLKREPWGYYNWEGTPAPRMAAWFPDWEVGTYTGVNQAAWTVEGTANYLVAGGEFLRVNGQPQEGLVRFAVRPIAPAADGPRLGGSEFLPTVRSGSAGRVRVSFPSNWDRDSKRLTYRIIRDDANANPIFEKSSESAFWDRPIIAFTDSGLVPGSTHTYKVRTEDPDNNVTWSDSVSVTVATTGSASPYADAVMADGARMHWRLGETVGSSALANELSPETLIATGPTLGSAGAMLNETNTSATFSNSASSQFYDPNRSTAQDPLSIEAWVKTSTKSGGRIMGFGDKATGTSSKFDRLLYMANDGRVIFGVNQTNSGAGPQASSTKQTVQSVSGLNNNQWHHVVGTLGEDGMHLFVDGVRVGSLGDVRRGQAFYGYWRIGADTLNGWPSRPNRDYFTGQIDEPAVYHKVLTPASVAAHYKASGRTPAVAPIPADSYGAATQAADPYLYYRLADTSGTDAVDSGIRANTGDYVGSATRNVAGVISGNAAVQFRGAGFIASRTAIYNPTNYSAEIWFNTTTALGGKLIGFGNARTDNSTTYDRHIYMQDDGKVVFGVKTGAANSVVSAQSYNNGLWHHAVATQGPDGMNLYVDGQRVGSNPQKLATPFTGYWRIGGDATGGASTNSNFVGNLDEAAVYNAVLSPSDVLANYSRGGGLLANTGPTAAFTASTSFDDLVADASASTDLDGSILSYEWDFGDSSTGTGVTATHRYATAGAYTVTLKVTDDDGATNQTTRQITTVLNQRPTAYFLRSSTSLVTTTNALASTDSDGSIVNYAWEFGDGSTGTGVTATHAYATAGTYTITLTVTDDHGATGVLSRLVTVAGAAVYASDAFERTLVNSFGTADTGGTWTNTGTAAWYSVNNGTGKHLLNAAGRTTASYLNSVSATDVSASVDLSFDKAPTGGGFYSSLAVRRIGTSEYRVRAKALPTSTSLTLSRIVSGTETTISAITLPGLIYTPGDTWRIKLEATGTGTTTLTAKLWNITQPEPLTAQLTSTDTTPSLQSPGGIGVINYLAGSVTNVPITVTYNNLLAKSPTGSVDQPNVPPVAAFTSSATYLNASLNASSSTDSDGSIVNYAWEFGDGSTGTGVTATHAYATPGTYTITLTVTDDDDAWTQTSKVLTVLAEPPPNVPPVAAFTSSATYLNASLNASSSTDSDGSIVNYAWEFGDGSTGTGVTATHAYATPGTYTITLTVTDDRLGTHQASQQLVVASPPAPVASDAFERTLVNSFGTADTGGTWTNTGTAAWYSVNNGTGKHLLNAAGRTTASYLNSVSATDVSASVDLSFDKAPTGGGFYSSLAVRRIGTSEYRVRAKALPTSTSLTLSRIVSGTETTISAITLPGLIYTPGDTWRIKLEATGTGTTTLTAKLWNITQPEPLTAQLTSTDTTPSLQSPGGIGVINYLAGSVTNVPITVTYNNLLVVPKN